MARTTHFAFETSTVDPSAATTSGRIATRLLRARAPRECRDGCPACAHGRPQHGSRACAPKNRSRPALIAADPYPSASTHATPDSFAAAMTGSDCL